MPSNHLEQLVAEWYEYQGYFVRRNIMVGRRPKGGYECELDVVAFHPVKHHLVQIEPSLDSNSWSERERRYQKKFIAGRQYIPSLFQGFEIPSDIEQIAIFLYGSTANHKEIGGGKVLMVADLLKDIFHELRDKHISNSAVPEHLVVLRSFQFVSEYRKSLLSVLDSEPTR